MMRLGSILLLTTLFSGCAASLQEMSAGHVGCRPAEIEISDEQQTSSRAQTWNARCNQKAYLCSRADTGHGFDIACTPTGG
jgi:hypothetical protein